MRKYNKMFNGMSKKDKIKAFKEMYHKPKRRGNVLSKLIKDVIRKYHHGALGFGIGTIFASCVRLAKRHDNTNIGF